jgi:hypothetical protein
MNKKIVAYLFLFLLVASCVQKEVLLECRWIVIDGTYLGKPIQFQNTATVQLVDEQGDPIKYLLFSKNARVSLPGIHTPNISALWKVEDDRIDFILNSSPNDYDISFDLSFLDPTDSARIRSELEYQKDAKKYQLEMNNFKRAVEIYSQPFRYFITHDTLMLVGPHGTIRAVRDRSLDGFRDIFNED